MKTYSQKLRRCKKCDAVAIWKKFIYPYCAHGESCKPAVAR